MVNIDSALKTIYKSDMFPLSSSIADKDLDVYFPDLGLTVSTDQFAEDKGEFELDESICKDQDLKFGKCNASSTKFTLANVTDAIKGKEFTLTQKVLSGGTTYTMPLGTFKVDTVTKQDDLIFKDVVAYDRMKKIDVDVAAWYNSLFPVGNETYTLAQFRASYLAYVGLIEDTSKLPLPNDSMVVKKTISPSQLSGRDVIEAIEEINGAFGKITRDGKFGHKVLPPAYGLYPGTFYPGQEYPRSETDTSYVAPGTIAETITSGMIESIRFEEYTVKEIDKLIIRQEENDVGAIVGTGTNAYIIEGNFLVFGKTAAELEVIAQNAFGNIAKRPYRPYESKEIGLPYLEVGDMVKFDQTDPVTGYIFQRTLKGIQALQDEVSAEGSQERQQSFGVNKQIIQLQGKTTKIQKDVDGVKVEVTDLAESTAANFTILSNQITQSVSDLDQQLTGEINVLAGDVELKVDKAGVIAAINLSAETATIDAAKINLTGYVTITSLSTPGSVEIDGGNLKAGTVVADTVRATWVYAGKVQCDQLQSGGTISGVTFVSTNGTYTTTISNGFINSSFVEFDVADITNLNVDGYIYVGNNISMFSSTGYIEAARVTAPVLSCTDLICTTLNGFTPITSDNIDEQSVSYATNAGSAISAGSASSASSAIDATYLVGSGGRYSYISANDNLLPSAGGMYVGSSGSYWAGAYLGSGSVVVSDENKKNSIDNLSDKYLMFAKKIIPRIFKYNDGTSNRFHVGFIAQEVEEAMTLCNISDLEFAGLIKSPIYAKRLFDEMGNETNDYDTSSEIVGYDYGLRYDEFIPLLFALCNGLLNSN